MATIICSHGFGVQADARGMFTEIAEAFPDHTFITFDYNQVNDDGNLLVAPLNEQVQVLQEQLDRYPESILLAHSQGCVVAGMADISNVAQVILLAPPDKASPERVERKLAQNPSSETNLDGISRLPRSDGSITLISRQYIDSLKDLKPLALYKSMAELRPVTIIRATNDQVLGMTNVDELSAVTLIDIDSDHDFHGKARRILIETLAGVLR